MRHAKAVRRTQLKKLSRWLNRHGFGPVRFDVLTSAWVYRDGTGMSVVGTDGYLRRVEWGFRGAGTLRLPRHIHSGVGGY